MFALNIYGVAKSTARRHTLNHSCGANEGNRPRLGRSLQKREVYRCRGADT